MGGTYTTAIGSGPAVGCSATVVVRIDRPATIVGGVGWSSGATHAALIPGWGSGRGTATLPGGC